MSLVEALDKGCVPLLGTARFLFCGSRFLRVRSPRALPRTAARSPPCRAPLPAAPVSPRPLRLSFVRPFSGLAPLRQNK